MTAIFAVSSSAQTSVLTANYGPGRTNANLSETQLTTGNVGPGTFGALGALPADGEIFAQPLYVSGVTIGQATHNILLICTEHNSVYAYDADQISPPDLLWQVNLGPSVPVSMITGSTGTYYDVYPEIGILGTGVVDPAAGVLYVAAETLQNGTPLFQLHALDLTSGQERMNGPVVMSASVPVSGQGATSAAVAFDPAQHIQRTGLLLVNGTVSAGFGSHGDGGVWHGWLMSYSAADLTKQLGVFLSTRTGAGGAIWQSGRGPAADDAGNIYLITGNGDYDGTQNFSESFVKVSAGTAALSDWYTPANWQDLSDNDYDLSAGPALIPGTHMLVGGDKSGNLYLVNGDSMGHLDSGNSAQIFQAVSGYIFTFALWARQDDSYVYVREQDGSLNCIRIVGGSFDTSTVSASNSMGGAARIGMALSANGATDGTGILWVTSGAYQNPSNPGVLHAFDASNLSNELWNSAMAPQDNLNGFIKFVSPTVVNGKVYAASSASVMVYGLLGGDPTGQPQPAIVMAANSASYDPATVSPGELIAIFGSNLGPAAGLGMQLDAFGNVPTFLSGTQVQFDGLPAPVVYAASNQVNAIVPFGLLTATSQVQVLYQGQPSAAFPVALLPATPGIFTADSSGTGQALAANQDYTLNNSQNPAAAGSTIILYATGGGLTSPAVPDGSVITEDQLPKPVLPVTAQIGGQPATVLYAGGAPGMVAGVMQVNLQVPVGLAAGPVPVILAVGGQSSQPDVTIAVR